MIRRPYKETAKALLFLCSLWMLGACSQTTTRSRPEPMERPLEIEAPAAVPLEVPPKAKPVASLTPETPADAKLLPVKPEPRFHVHVVQWQGETLSLIAQWYTLSWLNWEAIAAANPGIDPKRITIGSRVRIPEHLLKTREPMPFDLLRSSSESKGIAPPSPARTAPQKPADNDVPEPAKASEKPDALPEEVELFGPQAADARGAANVPEEVELFGPGEMAGKQPKTPEEPELFGPVE